MHFRRFISSLMLIAASFLLSCSMTESGEQDNRELSGDIDVLGGKNRIIIRWEGVNNEDTALQFVIAGDRILDVEHRSSGSESVEGLAEGTVGVTVQLVKDGKVVAQQEKSAVVLGSRYEAGLKKWEIENYSLEKGLFNCSMSPTVYGGLYGEEFLYKDKSGSQMTMFLEYDDAKTSHSTILQDVAGNVWRRTAYMPDRITGDVFYTSYEELKERAEISVERLSETINGYRGIWFDLGQATDYGSKYCGGLGTYTMKHIPMAMYAEAVDKTFFVYGGTTKDNEKHLLCMVGCYDHATGMLQKPRVVMDKWEQTEGVKDPHDDPTIQIDKDGYIWVFVSGRSTKRKGRIYRSYQPYDIRGFEQVKLQLPEDSADESAEMQMAYPQIMYSKEKGFFFFFTRYDGTRRLYYRTSEDGRNWTAYKGLADIRGGKSKSGHYQISNICGMKLCTAFNRHINGDVDTRTSIYYVQSTDWGQTWTTASGEPVTTPVTEVKSNALVMDYESQDKNCYIKDLNFDKDGNPVVIYVISDSHKTGPEGGKREWHSMHWDGSEWNVTKFTESSHCYDSGSIWVDGDEWTIIAPTQPSSDTGLYWGAGGEIQQWTSTDQGKTWEMTKQLTSDSGTNHTYVRRPFYAADGFYAFWADGRTDRFTRSNLYFCTKDGQIYRMPYEMTEEWQQPEKYN